VLETELKGTKESETMHTLQRGHDVELVLKYSSDFCGRRRA